MADLTTDRDDPRLTHGVDAEPVPQAAAYLVLSDEERAKGFVRPVRTAYVHVGTPGPTRHLRDLTDEEIERFNGYYAKFETDELDMKGGDPTPGRYWTQEQLDNIGKGCGTITTMSLPLAETYAREPNFYGATYCVRCSKHLPVGLDGEFVWDGTDERVGS